MFAVKTNIVHQPEWHLSLCATYSKPQCQRRLQSSEQCRTAKSKLRSSIGRVVGGFEDSESREHIRAHQWHSWLQSQSHRRPFETKKSRVSVSVRVRVATKIGDRVNCTCFKTGPMSLQCLSKFENFSSNERSWWKEDADMLSWGFGIDAVIGRGKSQLSSSTNDAERDAKATSCSQWEIERLAPELRACVLYASMEPRQLARGTGSESVRSIGDKKTIDLVSRTFRNHVTLTVSSSMRESSTTLPTQSLSTASQLTIATSSPFSRTLAKEHCVIIKYIWACIYARLACKAPKKLIMGHDNTCARTHT